MCKDPISKPRCDGSNNDRLPPLFPQGYDSLQRGDRQVELHEVVHLLLQVTGALIRQGRHEDNDRT